MNEMDTHLEIACRKNQDVQILTSFKSNVKGTLIHFSLDKQYYHYKHTQDQPKMSSDAFDHSEKVTIQRKMTNIKCVFMCLNVLEYNQNVRTAVHYSHNSFN